MEPSSSDSQAVPVATESSTTDTHVDTHSTTTVPAGASADASASSPVEPVPPVSQVPSATPHADAPVESPVQEIVTPPSASTHIASTVTLSEDDMTDGELPTTPKDKPVTPEVSQSVQGGVTSPEAKPPISDDAYHTISGGPETLKELASKNVTDVLKADTTSYQVMGIPSLETNVDIKPAPIPSLSWLVFKVLFFVDVALALVSYFLPTILAQLATQQLFVRENNGQYMLGTHILPETLQHMLLVSSIELTVISFFIFFFAGIIDIFFMGFMSLLKRSMILLGLYAVIGIALYVACSNPSSAVSQLSTHIQSIISSYVTVVFHK